MTARWQTSVDQLIRIFRRSMLALLPAMKEARISWREGKAYDDWDEIAQCLYRNIVGRSLLSVIEADPEPDIDELIPRYGTVYPSYSDARGYIDVAGVGDEGTYVFVGFSTTVSDFDTVDCVRLESSEEGGHGKPQRAVLENVKFRYVFHARDGARRYDSIDVTL